MGSEKIAATFKRELSEVINAAKTEHERIKAKGAGKADNKKKVKKNAGPAPPAGIQLGKGSRAFFDYLTSDLCSLLSSTGNNFYVMLNKEL